MSLLDLLRTAGQEELDTVVAEMERLETELTAFKEVRRILEVKLGVRTSKVEAMIQGRKAAAARRAEQTDRARQPEESVVPSCSSSIASAHAAGFTAQERHRWRARECLMANGPTQQSRLSKLCEIPTGSITAVLKHKWFKHTSIGVQLTAAGESGS